MPASVAMPAVRQNRSKLAPTCCQASSTIAAGTTSAGVVHFVMALLSFVASAPRAYWLKAGNAYLTFSTSAGTSPIFEMMRFEALGQRGLVELRIMTRARDRTDVDEALDAIDLQHRHKRLDRQYGVPESEDGAVRPMRFLRWRMFAHDGCSERAGCRSDFVAGDLGKAVD